MSYSSKLILSKEGVIYNCLVRSTGDNLDLQLEFEEGGRKSCRIKPSACWVWWYFCTDSVRIELNCRTPSLCSRELLGWIRNLHIYGDHKYQTWSVSMKVKEAHREERHRFFPTKGGKDWIFSLYKRDEQGYYRLKQVKKKTDGNISNKKVKFK